MNVPVDVNTLNRSGVDPKISSRLMIADGDIHPRINSAKELYPWLSRQWQEHFEIFGGRHRQAWEKGSAYPKMQPLASRRDAWSPDGKRLVLTMTEADAGTAAKPIVIDAMHFKQDADGYIGTGQKQHL